MNKIIELTPDELSQYIKDGKRHKGYKTMLKLMNRIRVHADGAMPKDLIEKQRPSESAAIKKYREEIYEPETESPVQRVFNNLEKIRKSPDWKIKFDVNKVPKQIPKEETLEAYLLNSFPVFGTIEKWCFDVALRESLTDANAVIAVMPLSYAIAENEYLQPFPVIFNSCDVLDYVDGSFAVIKSTDNATYTDSGKSYDNGEVYLVITSVKIQRWEQVTMDKRFKLAIDYNHELGVMPCFRMGGLYKESMDELMIFKSRIDAMVPHLNKAARESNDLDAGVVQHMHLEKWQFVTQDCTTCNGVGRVQSAGDSTAAPAECSVCKGTGKIVGTSPFGNYVIQAPMTGQQPAPIPPAGYIEKNVEIITIQDKRIGDHIYKALSAINMNFLADVPLNQSGKAKEVDQDALNTFVNSIAEDLVNNLKKVVFLTNEYRYRVIVADKKTRFDMLPSISVPEKFDLLSSDYMISDIEKSRGVNINPVLINELMMGYAAKKFKDQPEIQDKLQLILDLDPFPGISMDDRITALTNGGITKEDFIISCNINQFILKALEEYEAKNQDFMALSVVEQRAIIFGYAKKMSDDMTAKARIMLQPADPAGDVCPACGGSGKIKDANGQMVDCADCGGTGKPVAEPAVLPKKKIPAK